MEAPAMEATLSTESIPVIEATLAFEVSNTAESMPIDEKPLAFKVSNTAESMPVDEANTEVQPPAVADVTLVIEAQPASLVMEKPAEFEPLLSEEALPGKEPNHESESGLPSLHDNNLASCSDGVISIDLLVGSESSE